MYSVEFTPNAEADLDRLGARSAQRVLKKLRWFRNFDALHPGSITGHGVQAAILYTYDRDQIVVHFVRHRREVYKVIERHATSKETKIILKAGLNKCAPECSTSPCLLREGI